LEVTTTTTTTTATAGFSILGSLVFQCCSI